MPVKNIPTPNRGQPIDVDYISQIANQVNAIGNLVDNATSYSTVGTVSRRTNELKIVAKTVQYTKQADEKASESISITFPPFNGIPIATATVVASSDVGDSATVVIKELTSQSASVKVDFGDATGQASININFIAIGLPPISN
jgi:hypothetical protein